MFGFSRRAAADVVVIGSGAAGLTAAIMAHDEGARVVLLERSDEIGGTSAVSGGALWVPCNHRMGEVDESDRFEDAFGYCRALVMGRADDAVVEAFVRTAPEMAHYLEARTPLRLTPLRTPDYHPEVPGAKMAGRTMEPELFEAAALGPWRTALRGPSMFPFPTPLKEVYETYQAFYRPWRIPQDMIAQRMAADTVALGQALVAALLKGAIDRNIDIRLNSRAERLLMRRSRVTGVALVGGQRIAARSGVILASGGFEWNEEARRKFLPGIIDHPNSPPVAEGDGLRMAMAVGADLANMSEVWNYPSLVAPGESYQGRPLARGLKAERSGPHIIWINGQGRRFVNEAANYNSVGKAFNEMDANGPHYRNRPAWAVFDRQYRERYAIGTCLPDAPDPNWILRAHSVAELAGLIGVSVGSLQETVARWNSLVREGRDLDFGRGDSAFDRFQGDHEAPHPNLGTIDQPPFYAFPIQAGALGTKGGPRTDVEARVLDVEGAPIPGLFAAGNVAASVTGPGYFGVGSTLGPAMTFGFIAGRAAARGC